MWTLNLPPPPKFARPTFVLVGACCLVVVLTTFPEGFTPYIMHSARLVGFKLIYVKSYDDNGKAYCAV